MGDDLSCGALRGELHVVQGYKVFCARDKEGVMVICIGIRGGGGSKGQALHLQLATLH